MAMTSFFYKLTTIIISPLLPLWLNYRLKRGKEDPARLPERFGHSNIPRPQGELIWCHGASVGETLSLLPLIKALKNKDSAPTILVTSGTITSARLMAERLPQGCLHQFIPLDTPMAAAKFLQHWQPNRVLWAESDLWPNLLAAIKERQIPAALINARMSQRSQQRWQKHAAWFREILSTFKIILAQSKAEAEFFQSFAQGQVLLSGNLKYAAAPLPTDSHKLTELQHAIGTRPCWLLASSHPGEEKMAGAIHSVLEKHYPNLLTIIVPRHPQRGAEILAQLPMHKVTQRSQNALPIATTQIYLADTLGELGLLLQACPIVAMGGSFVAHGGHNPIEPAQFSCALIFGPHMFNFQTMQQDFLQNNAALQLDDSAQLGPALLQLLQHPKQQKQLGQNAYHWVSAQAEVAEQTLELLSPLFSKGTAAS